jgi:flagellar hook protein FlgE
LDKDGFLTSQTGDKVQGYLLNEELSTETNPVFDTTLNSIDLDALNTTPKATDEMTYDINLDGEADNNVDASGYNVAAITPVDNLSLLTDTDSGTNYSGYPDFSTNKIIHDSLGGEHRLTANFYKRDVVTAENSTLDTNGDGNNDKYTSWIVQYTVEDYDEATGSWVTSGHTESSTPGVGTADEGLLFELRFDTSGNLVDVRKQADQGTVAAGGNSVPVGQDNANAELPAANWTSVGTQPDMAWVIDTPLTGAFDPLGNPQAQNVNIKMDMSSMTQFAGSYNLRGVSQNGFKVGDLVGITTGQNGVIEARYSNGRSIPVAKLGLANFADKNAMEKLGNMTYAETFQSGTVQLGSPQSNGYGVLNSGSLEYSNVDTTGELVKMIQTQRTYQASSQVLSTSNTLFQRILQI